VAVVLPLPRRTASTNGASSRAPQDPRESGYLGWTQFVETIVESASSEDADKSVNTKRYEGKKIKLFTEYLTALRQHSLLRHLAEIDPETKKPRVFSVCAGVKSEEKWQVLNASLLEFSKKHKKAAAKKLTPHATDEEKAKVEYEPNSVLNSLKTLFVTLADNGIVYSLLHDFNRKGGFHAYWTDLWGKIAEYHPMLGRRPNKGEFEDDEDYLLRHAADPPFDIWGNPRDALKIFYMNATYWFCIRGGKEVCRCCVCCFLWQ
jgi:hypothetical protein